MVVRFVEVQSLEKQVRRSSCRMSFGLVIKANHDIIAQYRVIMNIALQYRELAHKDLTECKVHVHKNIVCLLLWWRL